MPNPKAPPQPTATAVKPTAKSKPKPKKEEPVAEILYPMITVTICGTPENTGVADELAAAIKAALSTVPGCENLIAYSDPVSAADAMTLLGWETEDEYVKRRLGEDPTLKESKLKYGEEYLLKDAAGNKVRCSRNASNRPFEEGHAKKICQDIVSKEFKLNCENIIISRTGQVTSGQHRLIGLILAVQEFNRQQKWRDLWGGVEPYIETLIVFGGSDDPTVLQTIDNVRPRSLSDVLYTSPLFAGKGEESRRELTRILDNSIDLLWKRLRVTDTGFIEYQTHSASLNFFERHKRVQACVKHIFEEDQGSGESKGAAITNLGLNTGHAASLCYLMAQSATTPDDMEKYYGKGTDRSEKQLDFMYWDKALEFWSELAKNPEAEEKSERPAPWVDVVREALTFLNDDKYISRTTVREKHGVLALAWAKFVLGEKFDPKKPKQLHPQFGENPNKPGHRMMETEPTFGGVDRGTIDEPDINDGDKPNSDPTPEEIKEQKRIERANALEQTLDSKKATVTIVANGDKKVLPAKTPRPSHPLTQGDGEEPDLDDLDPSDAELSAVEAPPATNGKPKNVKPKSVKE